MIANRISWKTRDESRKKMNEKRKRETWAGKKNSVAALSCSRYSSFTSSISLATPSTREKGPRFALDLLAQHSSLSPPATRAEKRATGAGRSPLSLSHCVLVIVARDIRRFRRHQRFLWRRNFHILGEEEMSTSSSRSFARALHAFLWPGHAAALQAAPQ